MRGIRCRKLVFDFLKPMEARSSLGQHIEKRKNVRSGVAGQQLLEHALGAAEDIEPVMNDRNPHLPVLHRSLFSTKLFVDRHKPSGPPAPPWPSISITSPGMIAVVSVACSKTSSPDFVRRMIL